MPLSKPTTCMPRQSNRDYITSLTFSDGLAALARGKYKSIHSPAWREAYDLDYFDRPYLPYKHPTILVYDIESTGIGRDARIVQLAWTLCDMQGERWYECDYIVRPEGYVIPARATKIHGITNEMAAQSPNRIADVLDAFMADLKACDLRVAHNHSFDDRMLQQELARLKRRRDIRELDSCPYVDTCSMFTAGLMDMPAAPPPEGTPAAVGEWNPKKTPGRRPNLTQLFTHLFGAPFDNAHDALGDVRATYDVFVYLYNYTNIIRNTFRYIKQPNDRVATVVPDFGEATPEQLAMEDEDTWCFRKLPR